MHRSIRPRSAFGSSGLRGLVFVAGWALAAASTFASEPCGTRTYPFPYADVGGVAVPFCPGIMEAYVTGISKGTTPTTFSPNNDVSRLQMTTFLERTVDQVLTRAGRGATLDRWFAPQTTHAMQTIAVGGSPLLCAADGGAIWTTNFGQVVQVQANTGRVLATWTGGSKSEAVLAAAGKVFVTGLGFPGSLYVIDPTQPPGAVTVAASNLGNQPYGIAFDGTNLWTANLGAPSSVSIITPQATTPYSSVTTVTSGFNGLWGILYDGAHIWVTDSTAGTLLKLDSAGAIVQTVTVGAGPEYPVFDGANIWVPNYLDNSITVVEASTGDVIATIGADTNNMLNGPAAASFDGERVMVTNFNGNSVTLFKAADLSFIANVTTGAATSPYGACSDGINFWVLLQQGIANLLRL